MNPNSKVIRELKHVCFSNDYDTDKIVQLAHSDAAVLTKIIEVANKTIRYKREPITDPALCVVRIGQKAMQGVALKLEIESTNIKVDDFWKKFFLKIETNTKNALYEATFLREAKYKKCNLFEITNKTLLLSLSCYAKAIACSNLKAKVTKDLIKYILIPDPSIAELTQSSMGVRVEILSFSDGDLPESSIAAIEAWTKVTGETSQLKVSNLEFEP
ncbi:HDOD domain-containing protein [Pseudoalteromonas sp. SK20]|uniref:HDOD domain-containing protein n=1 Tax=Pseudoalteromonas sp. SK20 TaxID=1938367 RepID=UPI001589060D|nr:HDOD domain-containing protein [Pseudoalteromonas sp. SK20]